MKKTKINWCMNADGTPGATWSPVMGCTKCSPGCDNCYALSMIRRFKGRPGWPVDDKVMLFPERMMQPEKWKPQTIFVCSMSDLFHPSVPFEFITEVLFFMTDIAPQHKYLVLTKRPERMSECVKKHLEKDQPLFNVGLGVTVCNQEEADEKIPLLLQTPAAMRFLSVEPMLNNVNIERYLLSSYDKAAHDTQMTGLECRDNKLSWIICGGESGQKARPMDPEWARSIRDQCKETETPFWFKQNGKKAAGRLLDGVEHSERPSFLTWKDGAA